MKGLVLLRYQKGVSKKTLDRWELIEELLDSNRELRKLCEAAYQVHMEFVDSLNAYVEDEPVKLFRALNSMFIEYMYERKLSTIVKKLNRHAETIRFSY